MAVAVEKKKQQ